MTKLDATIISPMAVEPVTLHPFLEKIIDKQVNKIALNIFEQIVDFLCRHFYGAYRERLIKAEKAKLEADAKKASKAAEKVVHFLDGVPLFDRTSTQRVDIKQIIKVALPSEKEYVEEEIMVDGKSVYFPFTLPSGITKGLMFGSSCGTKEMFATDIKECPDIVIIYERTTSNECPVWFVNTTQPTKKITMAGPLTMGEHELFVAQPIAPLAAPASITVTTI